jgi:hypothetical protein
MLPPLSSSKNNRPGRVVLAVRKRVADSAFEAMAVNSFDSEHRAH